MNELVDAVAWDGRRIVLSLFAIWPSEVGLDAPELLVEPAPDELRTYYLEDLDNRLPGKRCFEYDLVFASLPADMELVVTAWLDVSLKAGAIVAWFAFEGSFDFGHILTPDVAAQVHALGDVEHLELALDDDVRHGEGWVGVLTSIGAQLAERPAERDDQ